MALSWPTLTSKMDTSSSVTFQPRLITTGFGDGYVTRVPDGINNNPRQFTVQYVHISPADHAVLAAFCSNAAASGAAITVPIYPLDSTGATTALFYMQAPSFSADEGGALYNWTIPLQEVFGE